jgi:predicted nucleic acid-binding protein
MTAEAFADTNLIIYAGSKDSADAEKKKVARQLLLSEDLGLSVQSLAGIHCRNRRQEAPRH